MDNIESILDGISDERHCRALRWFHERKGTDIYASDMDKYVDGDMKIVSQQGIHKPKVIDYALTIKVNADSKYEEGEDVRAYPDGGWYCRYHQFEGNQLEKDWSLSSPNMALRRCLDDGIPIVLLKKVVAKPKRVMYHVYGLGMVVGYDSTFFSVEGIPLSGQLLTPRSSAVPPGNATKRLLEVFDAENNKNDTRELREQMIAIRRGQPKFRKDLLDAYQSRCCVTGSDVVETLEAAHISPYRGAQSNHVQNGLLLRADIHTLFDLGGCYISKDLHIVLANKYKESETYKQLEGTKINLPTDVGQYPHEQALKEQEEWAKQQREYS